MTSLTTSTANITVVLITLLITFSTYNLQVSAAEKISAKPEQIAQKKSCSEQEKVCWSDYIHLNLYTKTMLSSRYEDPVDIVASNFGVTIGSTDLDRILNTYGAPKISEADNVVNFTLKTSVLPFLIRDRTVDQLYSNLEGVLKNKRASLLKGATTQIDAQLAPQKPMMPLSVYEKTRSGLLSSATQQIDAQLAAVRAMTREEFSSRAKDIENETALQEFAISYAKVAGSGQVLLFVKAGKFHMSTGAAENENQLTYLESATGRVSLVQGSNGPANTGAVQLTGVSNLSDTFTLRVDAYFFHDRLSFITGKNYVAGTVALPDELYHGQDNWWKIDSQMVRALITSEHIDAYITFANYEEYNSGGAGVTYRITDNDIVDVNFSIGRPDQFIGASVFYIRKLTSSWNVFMGWERVVDSFQPLNAATESGQVSTTEWAVGTRKSFLLLNGESTRATFDLSGQVSKLIDDKEDNKPTAVYTGFDLTVGAEFNARWR